MEEEQQRASQGETGESAAGGTSGSAKAMANGSSVEGFKKAKAADTGPAMDPKSHLDKDGKPLHLADNSKGLVGPNKWMWENAKLIFGSEEERKSSKCLGAWCLKCEEAGKSPKECYLNYHPTRNFKAISRHFKRIHADLSTGVGASQSSQKSDKKRSTGSITLLSNRSPSSLPQSKRAKITRDSSQNAKEAVARIRLSVDEKKSLGHRMISHPTFHPCGEGRLVVVTEHMLSVPLYRSRANQPGSIDIYFTIIEKSSPAQETFFRALGELSPVQRAAEYVNEAGLENADDMMIFLQGGPGFGAPVANVSLGLEKHTSWAASALDHYSRVVLMDQRGTGRSGLITKQTLTMLFPNLFLLDHYVNTMFMSFDELNNSHPEEVQKVKVAVAEASDFLSQFRADSIVLDAEDIKDALLLRSTSKVRQGFLSFVFLRIRISMI